MNRLLASLFVFSLSVMLAACAADSGNDAAPQDFDAAAPPAEGAEVLVMETSMGKIELLLFPQVAPKAAENFRTHAENGYYDNVIFHRVIPGFMAQGGDPNGTGTGGQSIWGKPFEDEFDPRASNLRGTLSMANAGPKTNGSQFFINVADNTFLDGKHSVFGRVTAGMDVVDAMVGVATGPGDRPITPIVITGITVQQASS